MKLKSINIKNFKSIVDITINEPNPFTVFVGPNGSGKSNIFEALEYEFYGYKIDEDFKEDIFSNVLNFNVKNQEDNTPIFPEFEIELTNFKIGFGLMHFGGYYNEKGERTFFPFKEQPDYKQFIQNHSEIFISNKRREKIPLNTDKKLSTSCSNLEKVLKRLLENEKTREEISEWLDLFIPEFDRIEVRKAEYSSNEDLLIFQKHYNKPFNKDLISDGTYNIIALLTAVYQSEEPQFLCIEEPENGLHPFVQKELVKFFRWACEEYGHYIWLNTHSQTIVSQLQKEEIITVRKQNGETKILQHKDTELYDLPLDEAWMNKFLERGTQWG